jgi:hypothetical protein
MHLLSCSQDFTLERLTFMLIHFTEQDVVDACCVYVALQHRTRPEDVQVDLQYHPNTGFSAEARAGWRNVFLPQQELVDAIATYLAEYHQFNPNDLRIEMIFDDKLGIEADIAVL